MTEEILKWTIASDLERRLPHIFTRSLYDVIGELVANSFDADATRVEVIVAEEDKRLIIRDDGEGMDEKSIWNFYRSGDSEKRQSPISKQGRRKIGQYGIATILLERLTHKYQLRTSKGGSRIELEEAFSDSSERMDTTGTGLEYVVKACLAKNHGTVIDMQPVRFFDDGTEFSVNHLRRSLAYKMPDQSILKKGDRFEMLVNGVKVVKENPSPSMSFRMEVSDDLVGGVKGIFHFYKNVVPVTGVIVKVNGRGVGQEGYFDDLIPRNIKGRILGNVEANGLHPHVAMNWDRLREGDPVVGQFSDVMRKYLMEIRNEVDRFVSREVVAHGRRQIPVAINRFKADLSAALESTASPLTPEGGKQMVCREIQGAELHLQVLGDHLPLELRKEGYTLHLIERDNQNPPAEIDAETGRVIITANHPLFTLHTFRFAADDLKLKLMGGVARAMGIHNLRVANSKNGLDGILAARDQRVGELAAKIFAGSATLAQYATADDKTGGVARINPIRLYKDEELSAATRLDRVWINILEESGLLPPFVDGGVGYRYGKDVISILKKIETGTPAFQLVRDYKEKQSRAVVGEDGISRAAVEDAYSNIDRRIQGLKTPIPFVQDIGISRPLYLINKGGEERFLQIYTSGHLKIGGVIQESLLETENSPSSAKPIPSAEEEPILDIEPTEVVDSDAALADELLEKRVAATPVQAPKKRSVPDHPVTETEKGRARIYTPGQHYEVGEVVRSGGFNDYGRVVEQKGRAKILVRFNTVGEKTLINK
ncbi:MAG: ATP-binding protein [Nanoarchaeota archaeon]